MKNLILAKCIKTYVEENHMRQYSFGLRKKDDVKIYHKGKNYFVSKNYYNPYFFKPLNQKSMLIKFIEAGNQFLFGGKSVCDPSFKMF